jgi:hypothetical protein
VFSNYTKFAVKIRFSALNTIFALPAKLTSVIWVKAKAILMNAPGDLYNPTAEAAEDAKSIPGARYVVIPSLQGHFAASPEKAADVEFMNRTITAKTVLFATPILRYPTLEPIREVWNHDEAFAAASRLSVMRIMAKRTNAATVVA